MDRPSREPALNADPAAQARLLDLQADDTRLSQIAHRRRTLPEAASLAEIDERIERTADELVAAETIASDLQTELSRSEADVEQVRERSRRDQELLDSGSIGDPKQLQSLQHELQSLARRQSELEDVELEIMERVEGAQAAVTHLAAERDRLQGERATLAATVEQLVGELDVEQAAVEADRADVAAQLPTDLLALYERIRADHNGVGAAHLHRGSCQGCRLELPPNELERLRAAAPDEIVRCEECRRILVRTPESGL